MEEDSFEQTDSDVCVQGLGRNARVKRKNRGEGEWQMGAKKSRGGQKGQTGQGVAMLTIKVIGPKQMAEAYSAFKEAD